jgi:transposase
MMYILRSVCSWRMLPKEIGNWKAVYKHFRELRISGCLEGMMRILHKKARLSQEK